MDDKKVADAIIDVLRECQECFGHDDGGSITESTVPHGGIKGFQSDVTPTIVRRVARRLGIPLDDAADPVNIFASKDKQKKLSIRESAKLFNELYGNKGAS